MADSRKMETETDAGMSSAMHDIRSLASSYQSYRKQEAKPACQVPTSIVDPRVLLLPKESPNAERWKLATLSLMVLLGLSTAALAVSLNLDQGHVHKVLHVSPVRVLETPAQVQTQELPSPHKVQQEPEAFVALPNIAEPPKAVLPSLPQRNSLPPKRVRVRNARQVESTARGRDACDEVACLIGEGGACCAPEASQPVIRAEESTLRPYRLTRTQVMGPMKGISGRVAACFERHEHEGIALVSVVIAPTGKVQTVALETGSPPFQSCVTGHVAALSFPPLRQAFRVSYPFTSKR